MKNTVLIFIALIMVVVGVADINAQTAAKTGPKVTLVTMPANSNVGEIKGNINEGTTIPLRWAEQSNVACFPGTRFEMFDGNMVFYRVAMPAASSLKITVTPEEGKQVSLFAIRQAAASTATPPNITSAISCEANYPIYANMGGGKVVRNADTGIRKVEYISVNSPYSILIGVAGAKKATDGAFTMQIEINPR